MLVVISLVSAVLPMFCYLLLLWLSDKYDREPFKFVIINYFWGAVGGVILAIIGSVIFAGGISIFITNKSILNLISAVFIAPFVEEITKGVFLLLTITSKKFDNLTDGLVYGGAIGLGFGMTENFLYFISFGTTTDALFQLIIIRSFFSAVMHCLSTAALGAFLSYAKFGKSPAKYYMPFIGLFVAMFIHFTWNFTVSFKVTAILGFLFIAVSIILFFIVFIYSIRNEKKIILLELKEEAALNLIPVSLISLFEINNIDINSTMSSLDKTSRKKLLKFLTTLAFKKNQLRNSVLKNKLYYENQIEICRNNIHNLINKNELGPWR